MNRFQNVTVERTSDEILLDRSWIVMISNRMKRSEIQIQDSRKIELHVF